jgi:hypothetical protein
MSCKNTTVFGEFPENGSSSKKGTDGNCITPASLQRSSVIEQEATHNENQCQRDR